MTQEISFTISLEDSESIRSTATLLNLIASYADGKIDVTDFILKDAAKIVPTEDGHEEATPSNLEHFFKDGTIFDSQGIPWDERIHSSGQTFYERASGTSPQGSWKLKRNVDATLVEEVRAELRAKVEAATVDVETVFDNESGDTATSPVPPASEAHEEKEVPTTFAALMPKITALLDANIITVQEMMTVYVNNGVRNLQALAHDESKIPAVWNGIQEKCTTRD